MKNEVAVVVGVGPGLGAALVTRFAKEGFTTIAVARRASSLTSLRGGDNQVILFDCDALYRCDRVPAGQRRFREPGFPQIRPARPRPKHSARAGSPRDSCGQIRSQRYQHSLAERGADSLLEPDAIADAYLALHRQRRSAWTLELDLRPWVEMF